MARTPVGNLAGKSSRAGKAEQLDSEAQAVLLRRSGKTYDEIARVLGFSNASGAWKAVTRSLQAVQVEEVEELRKLEMARLDAWTEALDMKALEGDAKVIDTLLRIQTRRARYVPGLETPEVSQVELTEAESMEAAMSVIERLKNTEGEA